MDGAAPLEEQFARSAVAMGLRDGTNLVVTAREVVAARPLFSERRHEMDVRALTDAEASVFLRSHHATVQGAIEEAVQCFDDRGWLPAGTSAAAVRSLLLLEGGDGPRAVVECRDEQTGAALPAAVAYAAVAGLARRVTAVAVLAEGGAGVVACVLAPAEIVATKSAREAALTLAAFLGQASVRRAVEGARSRREFDEAVLAASANSLSEPLPERSSVLHELEWQARPGAGLLHDLRRRLPLYLSDWTDGVRGPKHLQKTISTTLFLFFIILLPSLALGESFAAGTQGAIAIQQVLWMQLVAGCSFALIGGQPLVIVMTTAPFALFTRVLYGIAQSLGVPFLPLYAWTGIFCACYSVVVAVFNLSFLIRYFTLFTEETFALFIAASFLFSSVAACVQFFNVSYFSALTRDSAILYLFLMLLTVWMSVTLNNVRKSSLFSARIREFIADFSLPVGVLFASFFGSFVFQAVELPRFGYSPSGRVFVLTSLLDAPVWSIFASLGFGLILAVLFLTDHSISSAMAQTPAMQTRKGSAYHWDLLVASGLCVVSSLFGLPWINASVPHAPMHTLALADVEEVECGGARRFVVTYARETRLAALLANAAIGLCVLALPLPLQYIPVPVLYGVFLFMALTSLDNNTFWERILLLATQRRRYPPYAFVRRVRHRSIHLYTVIQLACWAVLCVISFVPQDFVNLVFPIVLVALLPIRQLMLPCVFPVRDLNELDAPFSE